MLFSEYFMSIILMMLEIFLIVYLIWLVFKCNKEVEDLKIDNDVLTRKVLDDAEEMMDVCVDVYDLFQDTAEMIADINKELGKLDPGFDVYRNQERRNASR